MSEDEYNALAASRKYVWSAVHAAERLAAIAAQTPGLTPAEVASSMRLMEEVRADLAKVDAILDAEDGR